MTKDEFSKSLGKTLKRFDVDEVYKEVDTCIGLDKEQFLERIVTYSNVLSSGKYKAKDYIKAVNFCSLMAIGESQVSAYRKTFPDRVANKNTESTIQSSASIYAQGDLVQKIMAQSMIPIHFMFQSERVKALQVLAELSVSADSERIQMESADKLLGRLHETMPKEAKIELDVNHSHTGLDELSNALTELAVKQKELHSDGHMNLKQIAESKISRDEDIIDV
jgi:hypothetical protein